LGPEERVGAVREPTHSHGDPLFSMNVVSRDLGGVSREILEKNRLPEVRSAIYGANQTENAWRNPIRTRLNSSGCSREGR